MKIEKVSEPLFTLILTNEEAKWLKYSMQNPLNRLDVFSEDSQDKTIREDLFNTLSSINLDI